MSLKEEKAKNPINKSQPVSLKKGVSVKEGANLKDFLSAVEIVEGRNRGDPFVKSRDIVTLLLLFFTGIKISHLLNCTVDTLKPLINGGVLHIPAHQRTGKKNNVVEENPEIRWVVTESTQKFASAYRGHIEKVCEGKKGADLVITAKNKKESLERSFLDHKINQILKKASETSRKNITSHSFRISQVAHLIDVGGTSAAQKLMGHKDIRTTNSYDKRELSSEELNQLYEQLALKKRVGLGKVPLPLFA